MSMVLEGATRHFVRNLRARSDDLEEEVKRHRETEDTLRQAQKMEAIGQLTGGIAHDFNNLLTAIMGNLDAIRRRAGADERLQRQADNALEAARRGAKLTSQLLAFSRTQRLQLAPVDLDHLLRGMSSLLQQSVGMGVTVDVSIAPDAKVVLCDANQLELALLNLAVNARDAMPNGGRFTISTRRLIAQSAMDIDLRDLPRSDYVEIRIADTGVGMTEDVLERAIEPFFTTKPVGMGTGLGLSQVYGVSHECGGTMLIESAPGQGTTVRLLLPPAVIAHPVAHVEAGVHSEPTVRRAAGDHETFVLVVDDDRQVRRFITESLRSLGYRILEADSGTAALSLLDTGQHVDLMVADFAMPGMTGADLACKARERRPDLRVLMVSGYADTAAIDAALGETRLLRKPFDLAELGTAVAEVLGG
jgi:signal transduction histidine kinase/CheY-like chemotaxis protein